MKEGLVGKNWGGEQEDNGMNMILVYYCMHICENVKKDAKFNRMSI